MLEIITYQYNTDNAETKGKARGGGLVVTLGILLREALWILLTVRVFDNRSALDGHFTWSLLPWSFFESSSHILRLPS